MAERQAMAISLTPHNVLEKLTTIKYTSLDLDSHSIW